MFAHAPSEKPVVIIPLGLLFVPNDALAFKKLAEFLTEENRKKIPIFLKHAKPVIDQFKLGSIKTTAEFDQAMLKLIEAHLSATLTVEQFNACWYARYIDEGVKDLKSITKESKEYQYIIYGYTNPKDEEKIIQICKAKEIIHQLDSEGHLHAINGVPVKKTFQEQKNKIELFFEITDEIHKGVKEITLLMGSEDKQTIPLLKLESEKINKQLREVAKEKHIHVITVDPKQALVMTEIMKQERQSIACKL